MAKDPTVPLPEKDLEARVEFVQTFNVASGMDDQLKPVDHVASPFDHVMEVSN